MSDTIVVTLLAVLIAPPLMAFVQHWLGRKDRQFQYQREDEVAARAQKAAADLVLANEATARITQEAVVLAKANTEKLDGVHFLVNSNLTEQYESRLSTLRVSLVLANEVAALQRAGGSQPGIETLATIRRTEAEIVDLEKKILDRKATDARAAEMASSPTATVLVSVEGEAGIATAEAVGEVHPAAIWPPPEEAP